MCERREKMEERRRRGEDGESRGEKRSDVCLLFPFSLFTFHVLFLVSFV